jgi:hypothetical protein
MWIINGTSVQQTGAQTPIWNGERRPDNCSMQLSDEIAYLLTPRNRGLLQKMMVSQLCNKFPVLQGILTLIIVFTISKHLFISWNRRDQSTPFHCNVWFILILSYHLRICLPSGSFSWVFSLKFCMHFSSPRLPCMSRPPHLPCFDHPNNIRLRVIVFINFMLFVIIPASYTELKAQVKYKDMVKCLYSMFYTWSTLPRLWYCGSPFAWNRNNVESQKLRCSNLFNADVILKIVFHRSLSSQIVIQIPREFSSEFFKDCSS